MRTGISITITRSVRGRREAITRDRNASQKHAWRGGDHPLERRRCWHQRDHAPDRQVEDLRLALAGTVHEGRHRRPPARQDAALAHPSARSGGGRARGDADACRSAGRDHPLDRRSDGSGERHQRQRGPAYLEGAHGLQPHRYRQFKLSNDPNFVDKLRDVVGLLSIRRPTPSCFRSTRRAKSRLSIAPSRACR